MHVNELTLHQNKCCFITEVHLKQRILMHSSLTVHHMVSIDNDGVWREYLNGKVVNEYSGDTVPGTQEFDSSTILEKQTHNINWKK